MKKTKYLIPVAVIATGIFFGIYTYTHYTLFKPSQGPGDGFLPFILSVLLVIVGLFDLRKCGGAHSVSQRGVYGKERDNAG